jgi:hypothetical protein
MMALDQPGLDTESTQLLVVVYVSSCIVRVEKRHGCYFGGHVPQKLRCSCLPLPNLKQSLQLPADP